MLLPLLAAMLPHASFRNIITRHAKPATERDHANRARIPLRTRSFPWRILLAAGSRDEPLQHSVQIGFFLGADAVAADFAMRNGFEVESINQLVHRELVRKIRFVTKNK